MRSTYKVKQQRTAESTRAVLYVRVSSEHQKRSGLSVEMQEARLVAWCEANGVTDYVVVKDEAETGKRADRKGYQHALELLASGDRNMLVALKLDRIARSVSEVLSLRELMQKQGWNAAILDGSVQFDSRTANGRLMLTMFAAIAEWEGDIISERTIDSLAQKKDSGAEGVVSTELEAEIVKLVDEHGLNGTARILNERGVPTSRGGSEWYPATVRRVVKRYERDVA